MPTTSKQDPGLKLHAGNAGKGGCSLVSPTMFPHSSCRRYCVPELGQPERSVTKNAERLRRQLVNLSPAGDAAHLDSKQVCRTRFVCFPHDLYLDPFSSGVLVLGPYSRVVGGGGGCTVHSISVQHCSLGPSATPSSFRFKVPHSARS